MLRSPDELITCGYYNSCGIPNENYHRESISEAKCIISCLNIKVNPDSPVGEIEVNSKHPSLIRQLAEA
jgi:hypothetical protein